MKKALIVMAVLIAVVASTTVGGVQTASAFNPQPDPPGKMPEFAQTFFRDAAADSSRLGGLNGETVGIIIIDNLPAPGH